MAIVVEHEERRKKILEKALTVFMDDGFEDATFQKIADRCGITRTILYLYFKNKREIFTYSIKQLLLSVEAGINSIRADESLKIADKITGVMLNIFKVLEDNQQFLRIVLDYVLHLPKNNINPEERVRRRTVKLRRILSSMIIEGVKTGELKSINIKTANDYLYNLIEAAIFNLIVLKRTDLEEMKKTVVFAINQIAV
ncbi:MAG: TetR/AcrR family transcriptional regulator [Treponema sp.]|jgi:AcrR family transcriptional regulator|nr:TetR/AcrR family transcriptional regulator [Treponema sp.]